MPVPKTGPITGLLDRWSQGDGAAFDQLVELVYEDLRAIARRRLRAAGAGTTISTTALVHEAYLRIAGRDGGAWQARGQFFGFASKAMRHILVDYARRSAAAKRGGERRRIALDAADLAAPDGTTDILAIDEALTRLAERSSRMAQAVELRFFGGLTVVETAEALGTSVRTVEREWTRARAYLLQALDADGSGGGAGA